MVGFARTLLVVILFAACSSDASPASPSPGSAATIGPASDRPSPTPTATAALAPLDGLKVYIQDPDVEITLPEGWRYRSPAEIAADLEKRTVQEGDTESRARYRDKLTSGLIRMAAEGFTPRGVQVGFTVSAEDFDSTSEAVEAFAADIELSNEVDLVDTGSMDAPLGKTTWVRFQMQLPDEPGFAPSQVMAYLNPLDDGKMLLIFSTGRQDDPSHRAVMDQIAGTVRRPTVDPIPAMPPARVGRIPGSPVIGSSTQNGSCSGRSTAPRNRRRWPTDSSPASSWCGGARFGKPSRCR
jgi:hypothetical protein